MDFNIKESLNTSDFEPVYREAKRITLETKGNVIFARAIIEYSNYCNRNCAYCGINCYSKGIVRYRMTDDEILDSARDARNAGFKTIVLQGGEDSEFHAERIAEIVRNITALGVVVTVSSGEMSYDDYLTIRQAGASRYLLKHETGDSVLYAKLHKGYTLDNRIECLKNLRKLGYEVGSGFIIGLPDQTIDTLVKDIELLKQLQCDMVGISPFIPHNGTELANVSQGNRELVKRCVAITRILLPNCNLPITTAYSVANGSSDGFLDGIANVIMAKGTPIKYRKLYEIYPNNMPMLSISESRENLEKLAKQYGKILD